MRVSPERWPGGASFSTSPTKAFPTSTNRRCFWLLNLSTSIWEIHEIALRLPGSLAAVGTILLTYVLGTQLMSSRAGFWAALVVATSHVFLWYGRRVLFDSDIDVSGHPRPLRLDSGSDPGPELTVVSGDLPEYGAGAMLKEMHGFFFPSHHGPVCSDSARRPHGTRQILLDRTGRGHCVAGLVFATVERRVSASFSLGSAIKSVWNSGLSVPPGRPKTGTPSIGIWA